MTDAPHVDPAADPAGDPAADRAGAQAAGLAEEQDAGPAGEPAGELDGELDGELVRAERLQPYVAFTDPLAARRTFTRAVRLSRALRGDAVSAEGIAIRDAVLAAPDDGRPIPVRCYRPQELPEPAPVLLYLHGGAFVAGDLDTEHDRCVHLARAGGCAVVSVQYRRPPEDPFPAPGEDCYAALLAVASGDDDLGLDTERIAVGGSSAGGTLAAAVALMARDRGGPRLALQMLLYPALDDRLATDSMRRYPRTSAWTVQDSADMWRHYLGPSESARASPYAVPARAPDLRGLAPAYVLVAEVDALRDEAIDYAARMLRAGVRVELHSVARAFHGFDLAAPHAAVSQRALAEQGMVLRAALGRESPGPRKTNSQ